MSEFQLIPAEELQKEILTVYGLKGAGKTTLAMSIVYPDSLLGISFDKKTLRSKQNFFPDADFQIYDATMFLKNSMEEYRDTAVKSYDYAEFIINNTPPTDWILFDGGEILAKLCEQKMRKAHNLLPFQGFSQLTWWNERNMYLRTLHDNAVDKARKGVIYTIFSQMQEVEDFLSGLKTKEVPRWMDAASWETDTVLHAFSDVGEKDRSRHFYVEVTSSKLLRFPTGGVFDVTGKYHTGWSNIVEGGEQFSSLFNDLVGWYARRGLTRTELLSYYRANSNGKIDEQKWISLGVQHKENHNALQEFIREVKS